MIKGANPLHNLYKTQQGFTLLEIIMVVTILSVLALLVYPRISFFLSGDRNNFNILTSFITKTFDEAYLRGEIHYLAVHLKNPDQNLAEYDQKIFSRTNGLSVLKLDANGNFVETKHKLLQYKEFSDSFNIEEVITENAGTLNSGSILIPFYPDGHSINAILHIIVNNSDQWSVTISRFKREPSINSGFSTYTNK